MWDPTSYLRYGDERSRPFHDLIARVPADRPAEVVDLGCGPGALTVGLADRWPDARIRGLDSSPEMIGRARELASAVDFTVGDVTDWVPGPDVRVVVANAVLQWVPGHEELLLRWAATLTPGGWLAVQVPGNFDAPSHRVLRTLAAEPRWRDRVPRAAHRSGPGPGRLRRPAGRCRLPGGRLGNYLRAPACGPWRRRPSGAELDGRHRAAPGPGRPGRRRPGVDGLPHSARRAPRRGVPGAGRAGVLSVPSRLLRGPGGGASGRADR